MKIYWAHGEIVVVEESAVRMVVDGEETWLFFRDAEVAKDEVSTEYSWKIRPLAGARNVVVEVNQGSVRTGHLRNPRVKQVYSYSPKNGTNL